MYKMVSLSALLLFALPLLVLGFSNQDQQILSSPPENVSFAQSSWAHPGYVVSKSQLDFIKGQVEAKAQPWTDAYNQMLKDSDKYGIYVSATRTSEATATVSCGPVTTPDIKCTDERGDALAAWANALAWYVSRDESYAKNAIGLMNKWSYTVKGTVSVSCTSRSDQIANFFSSCPPERCVANGLGWRIMGKSRRVNQAFNDGTLV